MIIFTSIALLMSWGLFLKWNVGFHGLPTKAWGFGLKNKQYSVVDWFKGINLHYEAHENTTRL